MQTKESGNIEQFYSNTSDPNGGWAALTNRERPYLRFPRFPRLCPPNAHVSYTKGEQNPENPSTQLKKPSSFPVALGARTFSAGPRTRESAVVSGTDILLLLQPLFCFLTVLKLALEADVYNINKISGRTSLGPRGP